MLVADGSNVSVVWSLCAVIDVNLENVDILKI